MNGKGKAKAYGLSRESPSVNIKSSQDFFINVGEFI